MDSTDIPQETLNVIFHDPDKIGKQVVSSIIEWNQMLDPSFGMVRNQIKKYFEEDNKQNALHACRDVYGTLKLLSQFKCPRNFMRAYLANIKNILNEADSPAKQALNNKMQYYQAKWQQVPIEVLETYFDAFALKKAISQEEINKFIDSLILTKKYNNCLEFIKFLDNIEKLVGKMSNKRDASKAADYVKNLKLNPKDYPALGERLYKNTARHFLTKHGWEYAQEIFEENPEALACIVQDLIYKKKVKEVRSIWSRHKLWDYLQKQQSKQFLHNIEKEEGQILPNPLFEDKFGPGNSEKYFSLSEFGINEKDVIWVDNDSKNIEEVLLDIENAEMLGIDTQSIVGQTKFQKVDEAAIIQISTLKKIYIFDGFNCNNQKMATVIEKAFNNHIIVGHSFTNDTEGIIKAFGIKNKDLVIKNLVDICKVYKCLNTKTRYSSLAHICQQVLGKELSKEQTLTNWKRRPLRRNQIHYAAMDAQIVLQIYCRWNTEYGQMVHYYADISPDSL